MVRKFPKVSEAAAQQSKGSARSGREAAAAPVVRATAAGGNRAQVTGGTASSLSKYPLQGKTVVIELGKELGFLPMSEKGPIQDQVVALGGKVGSIVSEGGTDFVVTRKVKSEQEFEDNMVLTMAVKLSIPCVTRKWLQECAAQSRLIDPSSDSSRFAVTFPKEAVQRQFVTFTTFDDDDATNNGNNRGRSVRAERRFVSADAKDVHWVDDYSEGGALGGVVPFYPSSGYKVVRTFFTADQATFLELHVAENNTDDKDAPLIPAPIRIFRSKRAQLATQLVSVAFFTDAVTAERAFEYACTEASGSKGCCEQSTAIPACGSNMWRALHATNPSVVGAGNTKRLLSNELKELVGQLYHDAWKQLKVTTGLKLGASANTPISSMGLAEVGKAEAALIVISEVLLSYAKLKGTVEERTDGLSQEDLDKIKKFSKLFFASIPPAPVDQLRQALAPVPVKVDDSQGGGGILIDSLELLELMEDVVRAVRSVLSVGETSGGNVYAAPAEVQYGALGTELTKLNRSSESYSAITKRLQESGYNQEKIKVKEVYSVRKQSEVDRFNNSGGKKIGNEQLLFHASRAGNWVGILGRGLQMPLTARLRRDRGMLGSGIYFGDSLTTALKYSEASSAGTFSVLVCNVALGAVYDTPTNRYELTKAPTGFDSVHGRRTLDRAVGDFADDEYVVYSAAQQHMSYLIEFTVDPTHDKESLKSSGRGIQQQQVVGSASKGTFNSKAGLTFGKGGTEVEEMTSIPKVKEQQIGLLAGGDAKVPLRNTRIKAKVIDLIAEVNVLQHYHNAEDRPIEAKYVFPLSQGCAVCGFEAYINEKKVVGKVKEKEAARKEYKAAVERGDGAYLMDESEETPDVFTVSVGNLPAKTDVVIRITYILELQVSAAREAIEFILPSSIHPASRDNEMKIETQDKTTTVGSYLGDGDVGLEVGLDMPFDIVSVECSHEMQRKRTAQRCTLVSKNLDFSSDFVLHVKLTDMAVPRIWVESSDKEGASTGGKAAMITFFPDILPPKPDSKMKLRQSSSNNESGDRAFPHEVIVAIDCSASMGEGDAMEDAQVAAMLMLRALPAHWRFNVVFYGSTTIYLQPRSKEANAENIDQAVAYIKKCSATLGGTDIRSVLSNIHALHAAKPARMVDVVLLSDGLYSDAPELFGDLQASGSLRVFPVACGNSTASILRSVATVGRGKCEVLSHSQKSRWKYSLGKQIERSSQPALTHIQVEWSTEFSDRIRQNINSTVTQSPKHMSSLFNGESTVIYGMVKHQARQCELVARRCGADVTRDQYGYWPEQRFLVTVHGLSFRTGDLIHRLCARSQIRDWTDGLLKAQSFEHNEAAKSSTKQGIIDLGCKYGLVTPFTSMIAVEERTEEERKGLKKSGDVAKTPGIDEVAAKDVVDPIPEVLYEVSRDPTSWLKFTGRAAEAPSTAAATAAAIEVCIANDPTLDYASSISSGGGSDRESDDDDSQTESTSDAGSYYSGDDETSSEDIDARYADFIRNTGTFQSNFDVDLYPDAPRKPPTAAREMLYAAEKRLEQIDRSIRTTHIQLEFCVETFDPNAKKHSDEKKQLYRQRAELEEEISAMKAEFPPDYSLNEDEDFNSRRSKMVEYRAHMSKSEEVKIAAEREELKRSRTKVAGGGGGNWDQFAENTKRFGVKSTYDENLYTTKLNQSDFTPRQRQEASRLAREIEESEARGGLHHRIERGEAPSVDEGTLFSDVARNRGSIATSGKRQQLVVTQDECDFEDSDESSCSEDMYMFDDNENEVEGCADEDWGDDDDDEDEDEVCVAAMAPESKKKSVASSSKSSRVVMDMAELATEEAIQAEKRLQAQEIEREAKELRSAYLEFNTLVQEQDQMIDTISSNINKTEHRAERGVQELTVQGRLSATLDDDRRNRNNSRSASGRDRDDRRDDRRDDDSRRSGSRSHLHHSVPESRQRRRSPPAEQKAAPQKMKMRQNDVFKKVAEKEKMIEEEKEEEEEEEAFYCDDFEDDPETPQGRNVHLALDDLLMDELAPTANQSYPSQASAPPAPPMSFGAAAAAPPPPPGMPSSSFSLMGGMPVSGAPPPMPMSAPMPSGAPPPPQFMQQQQQQPPRMAAMRASAPMPHSAMPQQSPYGAAQQYSPFGGGGPSMGAPPPMAPQQQSFGYAGPPPGGMHGAAYGGGGMMGGMMGGPMGGAGYGSSGGGSYGGGGFGGGGGGDGGRGGGRGRGGFEGGSRGGRGGYVSQRAPTSSATSSTTNNNNNNSNQPAPVSDRATWSASKNKKADEKEKKSHISSSSKKDSYGGDNESDEEDGDMLMALEISRQEAQFGERVNEEAQMKSVAREQLKSEVMSRKKKRNLVEVHPTRHKEEEYEMVADLEKVRSRQDAERKSAEDLAKREADLKNRAEQQKRESHLAIQLYKLPSHMSSSRLVDEVGTNLVSQVMEIALDPATQLCTGYACLAMKSALAMSVAVIKAEKLHPGWRCVPSAPGKLMTLEQVLSATTSLKSSSGASSPQVLVLDLLGLERDSAVQVLRQVDPVKGFEWETDASSVLWTSLIRLLTSSPAQLKTLWHKIEMSISTDASNNNNDAQSMAQATRAMLLASPCFDLTEGALYPFPVRDAALAVTGVLVNTVELWESGATNLYDTELLTTHPEAGMGQKNAVLW